MGLGNRKIRDLESERFADVLADAIRSVHKDQKLFFVDSNTGNSAYNGRRINSPFATIAQAYAACTAGQGDQIFVLPNHAETCTAVNTLSKSDVAIKGFKVGNKLPVITINGAVDLFSFTAAGQEITGLEMKIATTDAATAFVNFAAAKCRLADVRLIPSATSVNVVDVLTFASGGDDALVENVDCRNTTVAVNSFINIEAAVARMTMKNCFFFGDVATAGAIDAAVVATQLYWKNVTIATIGTTIPAVTLDGNPTGLMEDCFFAGTHTTLATNFNPGNALRLKNCTVLEETDASKQGAVIPAVDTD